MMTRARTDFLNLYQYAARLKARSRQLPVAGEWTWLEFLPWLAKYFKDQRPRPPRKVTAWEQEGWIVDRHAWPTPSRVVLDL